MSNFIAWGGGNGSSLTCDVHSPQSFGMIQLLGAGFLNGSNAARYVTSVTDSRGGTWVSDSRRIGTNTATDPSGNTLSSGPSFIRTDALGSRDLREGDTVTTYWDGPCDDNIAVVAQLGGLRDSLPTQYDGLSMDAGYLSPIADAPYNTGIANAAGNGQAFSAHFNRGVALAGDNLCEVVSFTAIQPGWTSWRASFGTLIDLYVSDLVQSGVAGTLTIAAAQANARPYHNFDPGGAVQSAGSPPYNPNIILASYQIYDDPLFFNSSPGPVSSGVVAAPPLFIGSTKARKH